MLENLVLYGGQPLHGILACPESLAVAMNDAVVRKAREEAKLKKQAKQAIRARRR